MARPRKSGLDFNGRKAALEQQMASLRQEHRDWMADVLEEHGLDKWSEADLEAAVARLAGSAGASEPTVRRRKERIAPIETDVELASPSGSFQDAA